MRAILILGCLFSLGVFAAQEVKLEELKMQKRFGLGFSAGGPLSVLGIEAAVNVNESFNISGGVGTGLDYSTFMVKARYFLLGRSVSPYLGAAFARWWSDGTKGGSGLSPSVLQNKFLDGGFDPLKGFSVFMIAPSIGAEFMHPMGIAVFAEVEYLFRLFSFSNGTYAGLGVHWYF